MKNQYIISVIVIISSVIASTCFANQKMKRYKTIVKRLTKSFNACGLGIRTKKSTSSSSITLSDIFADYEWDSVNINSRKRPLVAAIHGTSKTFKTFQSRTSTRTCVKSRTRISNRLSTSSK